MLSKCVIWAGFPFKLCGEIGFFKPVLILMFFFFSSPTVKRVSDNLDTDAYIPEVRWPNEAYTRPYAIHIISLYNLGMYMNSEVMVIYNS